MARRSGLGKGLGALIPTELAHADEGSALLELPVDAIDANSYQPRRHFDEEALTALAASVSELGVLQPILVRPHGERFELIAGERRWRAAKRAGLRTVPAIVRTVTDVASLEQALVENLHRQDLNALEEAAAYQQLIEDFHLTHDELATRVGKSRSAVSNALRLFQLPPSIQRLVAEGQLSGGHARALLGTPDRAFQDALARRVLAEQLSVRDVEDAVRTRNELAAKLAGTSPQGDAAAGSGRAGGVGRPAVLLELEELLAAHLDTRVKVELGAKKGRITVEFATVEDLERIYRAMVEGSSGPAADAPVTVATS